MSSEPLPIPELERRMRPRAYSAGGFLGETESLETVLIEDRRTLDGARVTYGQVADALEHVVKSALDQRQALLTRIAELIERQQPRTGKLKTALELASPRPSPSSELLRLNEEFDRRDTEPFDLCRPGSVPHFSRDNLPDVAQGYLVEEGWQVFFTVYRGLQECPWSCTAIPWAYFDFLILNRRSGEFITGPGMIVHLIREHQFFEGRESPYRVDPARAIRVLEIAPDNNTILAKR